MRTQGVFPGELPSLGVPTRRSRCYRATGEFRAPRKGEYYLSGAIIMAYRAPNDLTQAYWIAAEVAERRIRDRRRGEL